jgi:hypothetical protein
MTTAEVAHVEAQTAAVEAAAAEVAVAGAERFDRNLTQWSGVRKA